MKLNFSKKILIAAITTLLVVIVLDIIFSNLLLGKIMSINEKVRQQDISSQSRLNELTLRSSIDNTEEERTKLTEYFVGAGNLETVNFTKYLEDLALEKKVTQKKSLDNEAVADLPSSDIVSSLRFRFSISGRFEDVYNFLLALENMPKVLLINSVRLNLDSGSGTTGGKKVWSADMDFSVVKLKN